MKLHTIILMLEKARKDYLDKHGVEPHFGPSLHSDFILCSEIRANSTTGEPVYAQPIKAVNNSLLKRFTSCVSK